MPKKPHAQRQALQRPIIGILVAVVTLLVMAALPCASLLQNADGIDPLTVFSKV